MNDVKFLPLSDVARNTKKSARSLLESALDKGVDIFIHAEHKVFSVVRQFVGLSRVPADPEIYFPVKHEHIRYLALSGDAIKSLIEFNMAEQQYFEFAKWIDLNGLVVTKGVKKRNYIPGLFELSEKDRENRERWKKQGIYGLKTGIIDLDDQTRKKILSGGVYDVDKIIDEDTGEKEEKDDCEIYYLSVNSDEIKFHPFGACQESLFPAIGWNVVSARFLEDQISLSSYRIPSSIYPFSGMTERLINELSLPRFWRGYRLFARCPDGEWFLHRPIPQYDYAFCCYISDHDLKHFSDGLAPFPSPDKIKFGIKDVYFLHEDIHRLTSIEKEVKSVLAVNFDMSDEVVRIPGSLREMEKYEECRHKALVWIGEIVAKDDIGERLKKNRILMDCAAVSIMVWADVQINGKPDKMDVRKLVGLIGLKNETHEAYLSAMIINRYVRSPKNKTSANKQLDRAIPLVLTSEAMEPWKESGMGSILQIAKNLAELLSRHRGPRPVDLVKSKRGVMQRGLQGKEHLYPLIGSLIHEE
jgi:hypothetical protein